MWKLLVVLLLTPAVEACPLGKGEEQLTIQRVMRNLGRFSIAPDSVALKGVNPNDKVSANELTKAIADLTIAISCARAVIDAPVGALLPTCTEALSGQKRDQYIDLYLKLMKDFESEMIIYRSLFQAALNQSENSRNFTAIYEQSKKIETLVDESHKVLFGN